MNGSLSEQVASANRELHANKLVEADFGNVSGIDRELGVMAIKPSGVPCNVVAAADVALVRLDDGEHVGGLKPSSDTATHLALYRVFDAIGGIAHSHSTWATAWAQALRPIPCVGTTHADSFLADIPLTRAVTVDEINGSYEGATGEVIVETLARSDPLEVPAVLVASHGPFAWGATPAEAVANAATLERVALLAYHTVVLNPGVEQLPVALHDKHFFRKHGPTAYYGQ